jgi:signal transduction histidine kinase/DNA-binding response OmpR family regulator
MSAAFLSLTLRFERDIVLARQRARVVAEQLGFESQDQTRISTAVSEIARNAFDYGGGGTVEFRLEGRTQPQVLVVEVADSGVGIPDLTAILEGGFRSESGMGLGIVGARRLMDHFHIVSAPGQGTRVTLKKLLPRGHRPFGPSELAHIADRLAAEQPRDAVEEVQRQNQELLRVLGELTRRQDELTLLNRELEDTNRGVVALYAELDEKADHLRRADEMKTRFISNMSHEFRTPVNSIMALAALLLDRVDGPLNAEQERQVSFIRKAADSLAELVNDLLDLAKVEAGKTVVRPVEFEVPVLFGTLRGMLRPLLVNESVRLVFEADSDLPVLYNDEGKVSQILRNFISNSLKFTEAGEVRVSARRSADGTNIVFDVADTGIGIAPEDLERIFVEFTQIDHPLQRKVRGTGLGLPLCRKLAGILGGMVRVSSEPGVGSTFTAEIPIIYPRAAPPAIAEFHVAPGRVPILFVEDEPEDLLVYERQLSGTRYEMVAARTLRDARAAIKAITPEVIVLDILLSGEDSWELLAELKRREETRHIPVLVASTSDDAEKAYALGADLYCHKPVDRGRLLWNLSRLVPAPVGRRILIVDDDEIARYLIRQALKGTEHAILEAAGGFEGLRMAEREAPDIVLLDLTMPDLEGYEVIRRLSAQAETRSIPIVVVSSSTLTDEQRMALGHARAVVSKEDLSAQRIHEIIDDVLATVAAAGETAS